MTYLRPHNRFASAQMRIIFGTIGGLVLIFVLILWLMPRFFPTLFTGIATPFWRMEFSAGSGSLDSSESLLSQNDELRRELVMAGVQLETIQSVQTENDELKAFLGRPQPIATSSSVADLSSTTNAVSTSSATAASPQLSSILRGLSSKPSSKILAAVLIRPPVAAYDEFIIDIGQDFNISAGETVYAAGNVPIGRTSDVLAHTAKIVLFSSPGQTYNVLVGPKATPATAVGLGGGQYQAQLPRDVIVSEGDQVVVPSISTAPFGTITSVINDPAQAFEMIQFAPPVNIYQLRWVLVDTKSK